MGAACVFQKLASDPLPAPVVYPGNPFADGTGQLVGDGAGQSSGGVDGIMGAEEWDEPTGCEGFYVVDTDPAALKALACATFLCPARPAVPGHPAFPAV